MDNLNDNEMKFKDKVELANYIGLKSKTSLYNRAKEVGVKVTGRNVFTLNELNKLKNVNNDYLNNNSKSSDSSKEFISSTERSVDEMNDNLVIKGLLDQLKAKDDQIAKLHKLLDQSQQLQLDIQSKTNSIETDKKEEELSVSDNSSDKVKKHWWNF